MKIFIVFLIFISFHLYPYQAKITLIDNNFKDLRNINIDKVLYLDSEISFDIKKGSIFNLYRNIDKKDLNKKNDEIKKICIERIMIISVIKNIIKAKELGKCKDRKLDKTVIDDFEKAKIGDYIEIDTVLDTPKRKNNSKNDLADIISVIYMAGIDDDFNYLHEYGISEVNKKSKALMTEKKVKKTEKKKKLLPQKKKKKYKPKFGEIRL